MHQSQRSLAASHEGLSDLDQALEMFQKYPSSITSEGPGMSEETKDSTILYKCPYCVGGRFTAEDGWDGAIRHIKDNHTETGKRKKVRRRRRKPAGDLLLEEEEVCYSEEDLAMLLILTG